MNGPFSARDWIFKTMPESYFGRLCEIRHEMKNDHTEEQKWHRFVTPDDEHEWFLVTVYSVSHGGGTYFESPHPGNPRGAGRSHGIESHVSVVWARKRTAEDK